MKKILFAALLAGSAVTPASAAFINFSFYAVGYGDKFFQDIEAPNGGHWDSGQAIARFEITFDEELGFFFIGRGDAGLYLNGNGVAGFAHQYDPEVSIGVEAFFSKGVVGDSYPILDKAVPSSGTMEIWWMGTKVFDGKVKRVSSRYSDRPIESFGYGYEIVPEPASWALMIGGFGLTGAAMRRKKVAVSYA